MPEKNVGQALSSGNSALERFAQDDCVRIAAPRDNLQREVVRQLACGNELVSYLDAIGNLDGKKKRN
jgi:hypothetical protein